VSSNRSRTLGLALCAVLLLVAVLLVSCGFPGFASPVSLRKGQSTRQSTKPRGDARSRYLKMRGWKPPDEAEELPEDEEDDEVLETRSFEVDDWVRALSPVDNRWYRGIIRRNNEDGTYRVSWRSATGEGGAETHDIEEASISLIFKDYEPGDYVQAIDPSISMWAAADVVRINDDGTVRVKWEDPTDANLENDIDLEWVKKVDVFRDFRVGDQVACPSPEDQLLRRAVVTKVNADDGMVQVRWDEDSGQEADETIVHPKHVTLTGMKPEVGRKVNCVVQKVKEWAAFVQLSDGFESMLHRSETREDVVDMRKYVRPGDKLEAWISAIRPDGKIDLTQVDRRSGGTQQAPQRLEDISPQRLEDISPLEWLDGTVDKIQPFGAFVRVSLPGGGIKRGLVHISNVRDWHIKDLHSELSLGEKVRVRIVSVDKKSGNINLSMKDADADLPERFGYFKKFAGSSTWLTGRVREVADFGLVVKVRSPEGNCVGQGIVIYHEMDADKLATYKAGQEIKVRVSEVDRTRGHLVLTMKKSDSKIPPEYLKLFKDIPPSKWLRGEIEDYARFGAYFVRVTAPRSTITVSGILHISNMEEEFTRDDVDRRGKVVNVRVVEVDEHRGTLQLTMLSTREPPKLVSDVVGRDFWS